MTTIQSINAVIEGVSGESLFRLWSGNSYQWDALSDVEKFRWDRFAAKQSKRDEALRVAMKAIQECSSFWQAVAANYGMDHDLKDAENRAIDKRNAYLTQIAAILGGVEKGTK